MLAIGIGAICIVAGLLSGHISLDMARAGYKFRDSVGLFGGLVFGIFCILATVGGITAIVYKLVH